MPTVWPDPDELAALFQKARDGSRTAHFDFFTAVFGPLVNHLTNWRPGRDDHLHQTAAEDAVLELIRNPSVYDPSKSNLISFLRMAAQGDLLNALARERRHHRDRESFDFVELPSDDGNTSEDDPPSFDDPRFVPIIAGFTEDERAVFELMRAGERRTAAFAEVLRLGHLPIVQQERGVKQFKDRIKKRFERAKEES